MKVVGDIMAKRKKSYPQRLAKSLVIRFKRWWKKTNKTIKYKLRKVRLSKKAKILLLSILTIIILAISITTYYNYLKIKKQTDLGYTKAEAELIYSLSLDNITKEYGYSKLFIENLTNNTYDENDLELYFTVDKIESNTRVLFNKLKNKGYTLEELKSIFTNLEEKDQISLVIYDKQDSIESFIADAKKNNISDEYLNAYENVVSQSSLQIDGLVNKKYGLSETFVPDNLKTISSYCAFASSQLVQEAALAFEKMCMDAKEEKVYFASMSAYRSYESQKSSYDNYAASYGTIQADEQVAHPGFSEHQSGLAVNVSSMASYPTGTPFTSKNEYTWLKEHAAEYGFIFRYPDDKKYITGFSGEVDHLRYVGVEVATIINDLGITLEEYHVLYK